MSALLWICDNVPQLGLLAVLAYALRLLAAGLRSAVSQ